MGIFDEIKIEYKKEKEKEKNQDRSKCLILEHYTIVVAILFIFISFIFYYSLIEIGIPIQAQKSGIENLVPFVAYGIILLVLTYILSIIIGAVIGAIISIFKYNNEFAKVIIRVWFMIKNKMPKLVIIVSMFVLITGFLGKSIIYIFEKSILKNNNILNDYVLLSTYYNYHTMTGFPKILKIDKKKYLLNGYDGKNLYVQDLNKTLNYIKNYDDIKYKSALCSAHTKNYEDKSIKEKMDSIFRMGYEDDKIIIYDIIRLSPYTSTSNNEIIFKKSNKNLETYKLNFKNLDINKTKLINTCRKISNLDN